MRNDKTFSLEKIVANIRFWYHANCLDINNTLNQLHLMSDERNEASNAKHVMIICNDVFPRLGIDMTKFMESQEKK